MAGKTSGHGFDEPRKPAEGASRIQRDAKPWANVRQLLAANLETADPDVFDILQKVRIVASPRMLQAKRIDRPPLE